MVNLCIASVVDVHCVLRATVCATAHAKTTPLADFSSATEKFHTTAVAVAHIFIFIKSVVTTSASHYDYGFFTAD